MLDPNNQNYFSLEETQAPVVLPWWKNRRIQVRVLAVAGVLVGVGLVGYYAYQAYSLSHVDVAKMNQAKTIINNAIESCATDADPAACEEAARTNAAQTTGQASVCKGLKNEAFSNCVSLIAFADADPSECSLLTGSDEVSCRDTATLLAAKKTGDYRMCSTIIDGDTQASCRAQLVGVVIANGQCDVYGIDEETCSLPARLDAIVASGDYAGCSTLSSDDKESCQDLFTSLDQDGDGLSLYEEYKLGTSDMLADTDGDGYTDAQEVASGHDPLK